ncbi:hypothetical protein [Cyanobium sp. WAJ14-Wanaka]|nr:hypothetical protein [Cyanobium sp. WAJ14-Wanaka]
MFLQPGTLKPLITALPQRHYRQVVHLIRWRAAAARSMRQHG